VAIITSVPHGFQHDPSYPKGDHMKFSMSYKNVELREPIQSGIKPHLTKLERLLRSYAPDLIQLHATLAKQARKEEYNFTLNLKLPTGTLHCVGTSSDIRGSLKTAFAELDGQIKKHKDHVRHDYEWKRKRPRFPALA
jgi:ribosomal subunit interface protein